MLIFAIVQSMHKYLFKTNFAIYTYFLNAFAFEGLSQWHKKINSQPMQIYMASLEKKIHFRWKRAAGGMCEAAELPDKSQQLHCLIKLIEL